MSFWSRSKGKISVSGGDGQSTTVNSIKYNETRYCSRRFSDYSFSTSSRIVYARDLTPLVLHNSDVELLAHCGKFRTVANQAEHYLANQERGRATNHDMMRGYIQEQVQSLIEKGLLISEDNFYNTFSEANTTPDNSYISSIGVLTKDRPSSLERCLAELITSHTLDSLNKVRYIISDDSSDDNTILKNLDVLRKLQAKSKIDLQYLGRDQKIDFCQRLSQRSGVPYEIVEFAILNPLNIDRSTGANRNALLLETVSELFLSTDDDTINCAVKEKSIDKIAFCSGEHFLETWFYPNRQTTLTESQTENINLAKAHEELLGQSASVLLSTRNKPNLDEAESILLDILVRQKPTIAITLNGLIGNAGIDSPELYFMLAPRVRERLITSEINYQAFMNSREVKKIVQSKVITNKPWAFQTTTIGYDNRNILPPFFPVGYGQDTLFGVILTECFSTYLIGHLPFAILHSPSDKNDIPLSDERYKIRSVSLANAVVACVNLFSPNLKHLDGEAKLTALGICLMELAKYDLDKFQYLLHSSILQAQGNYFEALDNYLEYFNGVPEYWASNIRDYLDRQRSIFIHPDYIVPESLKTGRTIDEARKVFQSLLYKFGQLLSEWSNIIRAAKELKLEGYTATMSIRN